MVGEAGSRHAKSAAGAAGGGVLQGEKIGCAANPSGQTHKSTVSMHLNGISASCIRNKTHRRHACNPLCRSTSFGRGNPVHLLAGSDTNIPDLRVLQR